MHYFPGLCFSASIVLTVKVAVDTMCINHKGHLTAAIKLIAHTSHKHENSEFGKMKDKIHGILLICLMHVDISECLS